MTQTTLPPVEKTQPVSSPRGGISDRSRAARKLGWLLAGPAFVVMLLVTAYPIVQAVYYSLFNYRLTDPGNRSFNGLSNYWVILTDALWWQSILVTLVITVVTVAVELVAGFGLALVMSKALQSIRPVVRAAILIPYAVITVVSAFAWQFAFRIDTGFVNNWFAFLPGVDPTTDWFGGQASSIFVICLAEIWKTTPFISLLLLAGLAQVPAVLQEAAQVAGAPGRRELPGGDLEHRALHLPAAPRRPRTGPGRAAGGGQGRRRHPLAAAVEGDPPEPEGGHPGRRRAPPGG